MKKRLIILPEAEATALLDSAFEHIAGGAENYGDALGIRGKTADRAFDNLERATTTLAHRSEKIDDARTVIVVMSVAEAENLWYAADNSIGSPVDARERLDLLGSQSAVNAGSRGLEKLSKAMRAAKRNATAQKGAKGDG